MHAHEVVEAKNLSRSRRWLWSNGHFRYELPIEERARRVEAYRRQIEQHGEIIEWLPPAEPKPPANTSRFAHGDIMRPRR